MRSVGGTGEVGGWVGGWYVRGEGVGVGLMVWVWSQLGDDIVELSMRVGTRETVEYKTGEKQGKEPPSRWHNLPGV